MLSEIFKAYDVRGIYPSEINEDVAYKIGKSFVSFLYCKKVIVGRDMRISSPLLSQAFMQGVIDSGADAIDIGEVCTDATYFASGSLDLPAVMFTASHNPSKYNGLKFCKAGAVPINQQSGLEAMREIIEKNAFISVSEKIGKVAQKDILEGYASHVRSFIDLDSLKPLKVGVDAGNGMAGKVVPIVFKGTPITIVPLFFELDGSFPNHPADPSKSENMKWLSEAIKKEKCDFGMAFDGDADRIFFVDETGKVIHSSLITALISKIMLKKHPKSAAIYSVVCSHIVPKTIEKYGGTPFVERVGHSFIKETMRKKNAIFGGEHSAHYYYRDNYFADSGIISSLIVLEALSKQNKPLSHLLDEFRVFSTLEEMSVEVKDKESMISKIKEIYLERLPSKIIELDGLSIEFGSWWFNIRPSNTEPLLRLNMEANSSELLEKEKNALLALLHSEK